MIKFTFTALNRCPSSERLTGVLCSFYQKHILMLASSGLLGKGQVISLHLKTADVLAVQTSSGTSFLTLCRDREGS